MSSSRPTTMDYSPFNIAVTVCLLATSPFFVASAKNTDAGACDSALAQGRVCEAANQYAVELMHRDSLTAITVMQDVQSGSLVTFAASEPAKLDVNTSVLPLSTVKLMLAASWWNHGLPDPPSSADKSVTEMIVTGDDQAGRRLASQLRKAIGTKEVLSDFERYGFSRRITAARAGTDFWEEVPPQWRQRLKPAETYHSLDDTTSSKDWEDTLSLGEERFTITALSLSRFLQAIGNDGVMLGPAARTEKKEAVAGSDSASSGTRIMLQTTARKLKVGMRGVVERGTARSAAEVLKNTGWQIGGKTGTGPGPKAPGPESDGWFAGLVFDPQGVARFTLATFVRHGGLGGGNAARLSAELAQFVGVADNNASQDRANYTEQFAELERRSGGQIGVAALDSSGKERVFYKADKRFPMCSTFKLVAVAAVLKRVDEKKETLDQMVRYSETDLLPNSPITTSHVKDGEMTLGDLCAAAIQQSDNTAANCILDLIGGPAGVTQFARSLGDPVTRLDRTEPEMNTAIPGDQRDITTSAAMSRNLQKLLVGTFLTSASRDRLEDWLQHSVTGTALIRSAVPADWKVGDKTGRNSGGSVNDVAIIRPSSGDPLFLSIYTFVPNYSSEQRNKLVAELAGIAISKLGE